MHLALLEKEQNLLKMGIWVGVSLFTPLKSQVLAVVISAPLWSSRNLLPPCFSSPGHPIVIQWGKAAFCILGPNHSQEVKITSQG